VIREPSAVGRLLALSVLGAVALGVAAVTAPEVRAASTDLTLVSEARYDVQPDRHRVHVTVDITVANHLPETVIRRYAFDRAFLAVLPAASGFAISSTGAHPSVRVSGRNAAYTLLAIDFGRAVYSGRSAALRLQFDLVDAGGAPTRSVRVTETLATFPVWAYASDGASGSSAKVTFPSGYSVQEANGTMGRAQPGPGGTLLFSSGRLAAPLRFSAYFVADRPGAFVEKPLAWTVGGMPLPVVVRAWADDPAWGSRTAALVSRALPVLGTAIGMPYRGTGSLVIEEAIAREKGASVAAFDPASGVIRVAYYADPYTILRELALAWFNGSLLADRWADEAFASYYAEAAAKGLGIKAPAVPQPAATDPGHIALNAWRPSGRSDDPAWHFAESATSVLARAIASRAGPSGLQAVWQAAAAHEAAYQPSGTSSGVETSADPPDWRVLLDLLENRTGRPYDDLWRTWVVTSEQAPELESRSAARSLYQATVDAAGDWQLPAPARIALGAWQFDRGTELLVDAGEVLKLREPLQLAAEAAGLKLPTTVRTLFEGTGSAQTAIAEADAERRAIAELAAARAAVPPAVDPPTWLGLMGTRPDAMLASATDAFARGNLPAAVQSAQDAKAIWQVAPDTGRRRFAALVLSVLIILALTLLVTRARRGGRRARRVMRREGRS